MTQRVVNYTYGTGNPVLPDGSIDVRDGIDNLQSLDVFMNADEDTYNQRDGDIVKTRAGAVRDIGVQRIGDFTTGCTVTERNQGVLYQPDGTVYVWLGTLPKVVPAASSPATTGGIGSTGWLDIGDASAYQRVLDRYAEGDGGSLINFTPNTVPSLPKISIEQALLYRKNITDLGAVSGVPSATVDARVVAAIDAGYCITLPHGFNYAKAGPLASPSLKPLFMACPDGRATMSDPVARLMLSSINTFKFQGSHLLNINFVGADAQDPASQWMYAEEGKHTAGFVTENCSWEGFHTVSKASCIAVKHIRPTYFGCGDTGSILDTYHWTTSLFSSCNLNVWDNPTFVGKFGRLFKILGGYNNEIETPWFEKVETVSNEMFLLRQCYLFRITGVSWLENFKSMFVINLDGDGTENTQSDMIEFDGLHINNSWANDPAHSGQASGFVALCNRTSPVNVGNQYDTKFSFKNIFEHPDSVVGWALTRTGSTLNLASSLHEIDNIRLKAGHPDASDGMSLAGNAPDLRRHFRDLSSNKFDMTPGNYQIISGRNTTGSQKDFIFDHVNDLTYARRNGVQIIKWAPAYFAPGVTNTTTCGAATFAWSGGFTQTAFTVTSDERLKVNIASILNSDDEEAKAEFQSMRAAWREVDYFMYQLIDRVEAKGEKSRWHLGIIAQRAIEAFTRHGLDWTKYAIFNYDKWDAKPAEYDDDGSLMTPAIEAGDKYTVNYEEALILESAVRRDDHLKQEELNSIMLARIEALENK